MLFGPSQHCPRPCRDRSVTRRPNILLITSDQHRPDCFGFAERNIKTPNLDRLAQDGTRFDCAITPNVLCQPARASILTGMLPLTHGVTDNRISLDAEFGERGWGRVLSDNGYVTGLIGKAHFGSDPKATGWGSHESRNDSRNFPENWHGPYMGLDHMDLLLLGHWHPLLPCERPPGGHQFERWFHGHKDAWRRWATDSRTGEDAAYGTVAAQTWSSDLPPEWHATTWVTERAQAFLQSADPDQPFCTWISYPDPHHPFDCPAPWSEMYDPGTIDISPTHRRDLDRRPWWHRAALENQPKEENPQVRTLREEYSRILPQTDDQLAAMTANYYGMISFIDDGVGRILDTLRDTGLDENTIVIFTTDHGELLGDHGLYLKGPTHYDGLLRVGLIVRGPGIPEAHRIADPVSTLDLTATFYDWAGVGQPEGIESRSLVPVIEGREEREFAYNEWDLGPERCGVELKLRTLRTNRHRITVDLISGAGELYDLEADPLEMTNLFDEPAHQGTVGRLTAMIPDRGQATWNAEREIHNI